MTPFNESAGPTEVLLVICLPMEHTILLINTWVGELVPKKSMGSLNGQANNQGL